MSTLSNYQKALAERRMIISENRSRRMRRDKLPSLAVPAMPECPLVPVAYSKDGTYEGVLRDADELPSGMILKWEKAQ